MIIVVEQSHHRLVSYKLLALKGNAETLEAINHVSFAQNDVKAAEQIL